MGKAAAILLDGECALDSVAITCAREICISLVCSLATPGVWDDQTGLQSPLLGLVRGSRLQMLKIDAAHERNLHAWASELSRLLNAHAATPTNTSGDAPGISSLMHPFLPELTSADRITFVTTLGGRSCAEAALRPALEMLESRHQHLELLLVGNHEGSGSVGVGRINGGSERRSLNPGSVPHELILLQSEYDFTACVINDRFAASAWIASALAERQAVDLTVDLQPRSDSRIRRSSGRSDGADTCDRDGDRVALRCALLPSLLNEEIVSDALACVCHGVPLDAGHCSHHRRNLPRDHSRPVAGAAKRARSTADARSGADRLVCPTSQLELDRCDVKCVGVAGRLLWPCGSLAAYSSSSGSETGDGGTGNGCVHVLRVEATGNGGGDGEATRSAKRPPSMRLRALSRVLLGDLDLPSIFGYAWRLAPPLISGGGGDVGNARGGSDASEPGEGGEGDEGAESVEQDEWGQALLLRGLAMQLHSDGHALLCECVERERFGHGGGAQSLAANVLSLLAPNLLLLPSGPPHHCLHLKAVASPAQIVPPPPSLLAANVKHDGRRLAEAAARARISQALAAVQLCGSFNPLRHCTRGATALIAATCSDGVVGPTATSYADSGRPMRQPLVSMATEQPQNMAPLQETRPHDRPPPGSLLGCEPSLLQPQPQLQAAWVPHPAMEWACTQGASDITGIRGGGGSGGVGVASGDVARHLHHQHQQLQSPPPSLPPSQRQPAFQQPHPSLHLHQQHSWQLPPHLQPPATPQMGFLSATRLEPRTNICAGAGNASGPPRAAATPSETPPACQENGGGSMNTGGGGSIVAAGVAKSGGVAGRRRMQRIVTVGGQGPQRVSR